MRILPIVTNSYTEMKTKNQIDSFNPNYIGIKSPLEADTISFTARTRTKFSEPLKALIHYGVPDGWSGLCPIPPEVIDSMFEKHTFSRAIRSLVKILRPYEESMFDVEHNFFNIVKNLAKNNPQYSLEDVVRVLAPEYKKRLIEEQMPVFNQVVIFASEMPNEQYNEFCRLMAKVNKQINHEPISLQFSVKEFREQLHILASNFVKKRKNAEFDIMRKILCVLQRMPEQSTEKKALQGSKAKKNKRTNVEKKLQRKRILVLNQIEKMVSESVLQRDVELMRLLIQTRSKIYGMPIIIPFDRQVFIEDLQKITATLEDRKLANRINKAAISLPTSRDSLAAFIMNQVELPSDKIGFNMLNPSRGSIDHLIPFSKGGENCIENYSITTNRTNSDRAHKSVAEQLRRYPESYAHWQKQIDRLIELCNDGIFKKVKLSKFYIPTLAKNLLKLSPEEKPLILDIDKLK